MSVNGLHFSIEVESWTFDVSMSHVQAFSLPGVGEDEAAPVPALEIRVCPQRDNRGMESPSRWAVGRGQVSGDRGRGRGLRAAAEWEACWRYYQASHMLSKLFKKRFALWATGFYNHIILPYWMLLLWSQICTVKSKVMSDFFFLTKIYANLW